MTIGVGNQVVLGDATYFNMLQQHEFDITPTTLVYEPRKVCVHGTVYRVNSVVHTGWLDEMPEFSSISKIIVLKSNKVYFVLTKFVTRQFASHFHAFKVCKPARDCSLLLQQSQFKHYLPLHIIKLPGEANGAVYIVPRCNIPEC